MTLIHVLGIASLNTMHDDLANLTCMPDCTEGVLNLLLWAFPKHGCHPRTLHVVVHTSHSIAPLNVWLALNVLLDTIHCTKLLEDYPVGYAHCMTQQYNSWLDHTVMWNGKCTMSWFKHSTSNAVCIFIQESVCMWGGGRCLCVWTSAEQCPTLLALAVHS